jgi:transcription-repair coupling factor (superfamily II helicase)
MATFAPTSLALRALLKKSLSRLSIGAGARRVTGLTAPAKALFVAGAAVRDRVLLVVPTDADVERAIADTRFFFAASEGLSDADVEHAVLPFPSHEVDPYRGLAPHFEIASARARAMHALADGTARILVASASALLPRVSAPQHIQATSLTIRTGQDLSPTDLGDLLAAAGYTRQDPVDESGEFCVRGGVVDFFPAGAERPVRLEFVGDTLESLRTYDPATQRSIAGSPVRRRRRRSVCHGVRVPVGSRASPCPGI